VSAPDDRVLPATRWLSAVIVPFLVVAFVDLYFWPASTGRGFAWTIVPRLTPMLLGAVYIGGAYFFVRAARAKHWHEIKAGFVPVACFASLMGIATVLHWGRFNHHHVAFWLWAALYFTTPFLVVAVWLANRSQDVPVRPDDVLLPRPVRWAVGAVGLLAVATSAFLFLLPAKAITVWPWLLTPLTARVMGAVFALGVAAVGAFTEARWTSYRLMVQVGGVMLALIAIAVVRAPGDLDTSRALTWLFLVGFVVVVVGAGGVWVWSERGTPVDTGGPGPKDVRHEPSDTVDREPREGV
jgi:hypothetical protein